MKSLDDPSVSELLVKIYVLSFFLDVHEAFISQSFWQFGVASDWGLSEIQVHHFQVWPPKTPLAAPPYDFPLFVD